MAEIQHIQNTTGLKSTEGTYHGREYNIFIFTALGP